MFEARWKGLVEGCYKSASDAVSPPTVYTMNEYNELFDNSSAPCPEVLSPQSEVFQTNTLGKYICGT